MLLHPASCGKSPTLTMREWQAFFRPVAKKSRPAAVRPARTPSRAFPTGLPYKAFSSSGAFPGSGARDEIVLSKPAAQRLQRFGRNADTVKNGPRRPMRASPRSARGMSAPGWSILLMIPAMRRFGTVCSSPGGTWAGSAVADCTYRMAARPQPPQGTPCGAAGR